MESVKKGATTVKSMGDNQREGRWVGRGKRNKRGPDDEVSAGPRGYKTATTAGRADQVQEPGGVSVVRPSRVAGYELGTPVGAKPDSPTSLTWVWVIEIVRSGGVCEKISLWLRAQGHVRPGSQMARVASSLQMTGQGGNKSPREQ